MVRKVTISVLSAFLLASGSTALASPPEPLDVSIVTVCASAKVTVNGDDVVDESHCVQA